MNKFKSIIIYTWVALQVFVLLYLWGILLYAAFTSTPIEKLIHWQWWVFLFLLDLWTAKFFKELKPSSKSE
jgi:hypothetical protein